MTQTAGPPAHTSYSSIDTWQQCGMKYKLTRIDGWKEDPAWWSVGGSAVHTATEWSDLGIHDELSVDQLWTVALQNETDRQVMFTGTDPLEWRSSRGQDGDWWRANGAGMVQAWRDWRESTGWHILDFPSADPDVEALPGVELPINTTIGGILVKGYIDRVFVTPAGEVVIVDLKTGARKPASPLQLGFYRAGVEQQYGVTADLGAYWMARKKPGEQADIVGLGRYTVEHIAGFTAGFKAAREANIYTPHVTSFCGSCGVAAGCWAVN